MRKTSTKLLVIVITATAIIAAATTTQILQPAYSQASHCQTRDLGAGPPITTCIKPGQDASLTTCIRGEFCTPLNISPQEAGQRIGECHRPPINPLIGECTVAHL